MTTKQQTPAAKLKKELRAAFPGLKISCKMDGFSIFIKTDLMGSEYKKADLEAIAYNDKKFSYRSDDGETHFVYVDAVDAKPDSCNVEPVEENAKGKNTQEQPRLTKVVINNSELYGHYKMRFDTVEEAMGFIKSKLNNDPVLVPTHCPRKLNYSLYFSNGDELIDKQMEISTNFCDPFKSDNIFRDHLAALAEEYARQVKKGVACLDQSLEKMTEISKSLNEIANDYDWDHQPVINAAA